MSTVIDKIKRPELFFGFVSPIGADLAPTVSAFRKYFEEAGYHVVEIKVTDIFHILKNYILAPEPLLRSPMYERYVSHIAYGNFIRKYFNDDAILASTTIMRIMKRRARLKRVVDNPPFAGTVFLLHQFKRKEEIDLLRSVYGPLFFQVSIYSRRGARVDYLARNFASSENTAGTLRFRDRAEKIIQDDENEVEEDHGQRVTKIFHDADVIINLDTPTSVNSQVTRFCELLFGSNKISPNKMEYGMFLAKAAALRTLDLSRQVGAAIFSAEGEILSLGSNEVPKALGGTYWSDEKIDDREYIHKIDSNDQRKREILGELLRVLGDERDLKAVMKDKKLRDSQFMDALEYGRIVHAEMSAISDAARLGRRTKEGVLFCTTFPCHMCAKHIVAAGITKVFFLEPYPKSLASDLHSDSIQVEGADRGRYQEYPAVQFEHFFGVSPRRYREIFERGRRKNEDGQFEDYARGTAEPIIDVKFLYYHDLEQQVVKAATAQFNAIVGDVDILDA
jgi:deoxycytidylate deaminase